MYTLTDCNSFYCSAETYFCLEALFKPTVVLSNNDGCVISRSKEAKALGIKMGEPAFKREQFYVDNKVYVFSSNYPLYGSVSARVMNVARSMFQNVEVYSIDEFFAWVKGYDPDYKRLGFRIKDNIFRQTGIPVGVGIAPTKTLAKAANKISKRSGGVCVLQSQKEIINALKDFDISDVWGIGGQYDKLLKSLGIETALQLSRLDERWVLDNLTITGLKMVKELKGIPCYELDEVPDDKKNICSARSFGHDMTDPNDIFEAISNYAARATEKLRAQNSYASYISVFLHTNGFKTNLPQYRNSKTLTLPEPTSSLIEILRYAKKAFDLIFKKGYSYKKAGIFLNGLVPYDAVQQDLFYQYNLNENKLMKIMDSLNRRYGRDTLRIGAQGIDHIWWMRQQRLSKQYTTDWNQLLEVKAEGNNNVWTV